MSIKDLDIEFYLKSGLSDDQIKNIMKTIKKDKQEYDFFMNRYQTIKNKLIKLVEKFIYKIEKRFGSLEIPDLISRGIYYAKRSNLNDGEIEAFTRFILNDSVNKYHYKTELEKNAIAKFIGISPDDMTIKPFNIKPLDITILNKILMLYDITQQLYMAIIDKRLFYINTQNIRSIFNKNNDNIAVYIHPLVIALFLPRIGILEQRMLFSNFGRLVSMHTIPYQTKINIIKPNYKNEIKNDLDLALDMAKDPSSLMYFFDEIPIVTMLKRFQVQIELWKNIYNIHISKFYSTKEIPDSDDGISGFIRALNNFKLTYLGEDDDANISDEISILRKLLTVFAIRPTFVMLSSLPINTEIGKPMDKEYYLKLNSNISGLTTISYINIQIVNLKIPDTSDENGVNCSADTLQDIITGGIPELYVEHKTFVPKSRKIIMTRHLMFVYINRRCKSDIHDPKINIIYMSTIPLYYSSEVFVNNNKLIGRCRRDNETLMYVMYEENKKEINNSFKESDNWDTKIYMGSEFVGIGISMIKIKANVNPLYLKSVVAIDRIDGATRPPPCISIVSNVDISKNLVIDEKDIGYPEKLPFSSYVAYIPQIGDTQKGALYTNLSSIKTRGYNSVKYVNDDNDETIYTYIKSYGTIFIYADQFGMKQLLDDKILSHNESFNVKLNIIDE